MSGGALYCAFEMHAITNFITLITLLNYPNCSYKGTLNPAKKALINYGFVRPTILSRESVMIRLTQRRKKIPYVGFEFNLKVKLLTMLIYFMLFTRF